MPENKDNGPENKKIYGRDEDKAEVNSNWVEYGLDLYEQNKLFKKNSGNRKINQTYKPEVEKDKIFNQDNIGFKDNSPKNESTKDNIFNSWIFVSKEELDQIKSPQVKKIVKFLEKTPPSLRTESRLEHYYSKVEELHLKDEVTENEAIIVLGRIGEKIEEMSQNSSEEKKEQQNTEGWQQKIIENTERTAKASEESAKRAAGEQTDILPSNKEEQKKFIMGIVEQLESNDLPVAPVPGLYSLGNNGIISERISHLIGLEGVFPEIKQEALSRMKLQHCAAIADAIPGNSDAASEYLHGVFQQPESKRYALEGKDFNFLFKNGSHGLKIAEAFNELQKAAVLGLDVITLGINKEPNDKRNLRLFSEKLSAYEKEEIEKFILEKLGNDKIAIKSLQLAKRIAKATLETSVWNYDQTGNDPLSECIYLREYRRDRATKARDRGPEITIPLIDGFGTSFLRSAQTTNTGEISLKNLQTGKDIKITANKYLFLDKLEEHTRFLSINSDKIKRNKLFFKRNRAEVFLSRDENFKPILGDDKKDKSECLLNVKEMDFESMRPGDYIGWVSISMPRILACKNLLFKTSWKLQDLGSDAIESWVAPFNTVDPDQMMRLKMNFCKGMFWAIFSKRQEAMNNGWDGFSLQAIFKNLTRKYIDPEKNIDVAFLTEDQLKFIKEDLRKNAHMSLENEAAIIGMSISATKRVIGR